MSTSMLGRCTALLALATPVSAQTIITLNPIADATTVSSSPSTNYGSDVELNFGKVSTSTGPAAGFMRGHVLFDLTPFIGSGIVPVRTTFHWYQSRSNAAGCLDVSLHAIQAPWTENTITWANQPVHASQAVSETCVGNSFDLGWKRFELTTLAQRWFDGSAPNFGFVIRDVRESSAGASRPGWGHSRENGTVTLEPYLEIELADVIGIGCTTHASLPGLDVLAGSAQRGATLTLRASNLVTGSTLAGFFSLNRLPAPIDLTPIGFAGCSLFVSPELTGAFPPVAGSSFDFDLIVPDEASLVGGSIYTQFAAVTPALGLELTNGIAFRVHE